MGQHPLARARRFTLALALVAATTALHLAIAARTPLVPDEAYYWDWSRHLAAGYLDHPPAIALMIRMGTAALGLTPLGVRLVPLLAGSATALASMALARRFAGDGAALWAAAIYACMPLSAVGSMVATPDAPLDLFVGLTLYATVVACSRRTAEELHGVRRAAWWALAGLGLGLALGSKHSAGIVAIALFVSLCVDPELRRTLRTPGPFLAAGIALVVWSPVLLWNMSHGWVSFRFQLAHGLGASGGSALAREGELVGGQLGLASPLLLPLFVVSMARAIGDRKHDPALAILATVAAAITTVFALTALRAKVEANWLAPAYVAGVPVLACWAARAESKRWIGAACLLGGAISLALTIHLASPLQLVPAKLDPSAQLEGWDRFASRVSAARAPTVAPSRAWIAAASYQDAAELAFGLPDHPATFVMHAPSSADRGDQYALWPSFGQRASAGDDLVLTADLPQGEALVRVLEPCFASVQAVETLPIHRGKALRAIWRLRGWRERCSAERAASRSADAAH